MNTETQIITPRRNFLVRALGFTAAGATMAIPITTLADAKSRIEHHSRELEKAMRDRYGFDAIVTEVKLPEPGEIVFDQSHGRSHYKAPFLAMVGKTVWID